MSGPFKPGDKLVIVSVEDILMGYLGKVGDVVTFKKYREDSRDIYIEESGMSWLATRFVKQVPVETPANTKRLATQLDRVRDRMLSREWATLAQLAEYAKGSEASVSARLRDLRKEGRIIVKRKITSVVEYHMPEAII